MESQSTTDVFVISAPLVVVPFCARGDRVAEKRKTRRRKAPTTWAGESEVLTLEDLAPELAALGGSGKVLFGEGAGEIALTSGRVRRSRTAARS